MVYFDLSKLIDLFYYGDIGLDCMYISLNTTMDGKFLIDRLFNMKMDMNRSEA